MRLSNTRRLIIRWKHRKVGHPKVHALRVNFDEIIEVNYRQRPQQRMHTLDDALPSKSDSNL